jgi:hypothetical protein
LGGGVLSSAALTASISSRSGSGSVTAGMAAVWRRFGGTARREGCAAGRDSGVWPGTGPSPRCAGPSTRSLAAPRRLSVADRSGRSPLFTCRARIVARRPSAPRSLRGTHRTEHIRLDQVIPAAGPAYLHHVYREFVVPGGQHHQLFGGASRPRHRTEMITEHPGHQRQLLLATNWTHHRTGLAVVLGCPQQIGISVADLCYTGASGIHLGQQGPAPERVVHHLSL